MEKLLSTNIAFLQILSQACAVTPEIMISLFAKHMLKCSTMYVPLQLIVPSGKLW